MSAFSISLSCNLLSLEAVVSAAAVTAALAAGPVTIGGGKTACMTDAGGLPGIMGLADIGVDDTEGTFVLLGPENDFPA